MNTEKSITRREENTPERIKERRSITPPVDIYENEREILLVADIPGVMTDRLNINLEGGELTIEGCRPEQTEGTTLAESFETCDYIRTFKVPTTIDFQRIEAELTHGVLTVHLPKHESVRPRRITVKAG